MTPSAATTANPATGAAIALSIGFTEITDDVGLRFMHDAGAAGAYRYQEIMGPGCALADFDGDGRLDVYLVNGVRPSPSDGSPPATDRLYRQQADGTFVNVMEESGIRPTGYGMGCVVGDYDNDGDLDLFLTNFGPDQLWRNNGDGTFIDVTASAGLDNRLWSVSASFFDYDRDGRLDLYVINYLLDPNSVRCHDLSGRLDYCGPVAPAPASDRLYHNEGDGRFRDVSAASGIAGVSGPGLGVVCADFNEDGWEDMYVANDMAPNYLWINRRDGTFEESAIALGCALNRNGAAEAGMGIAPGDVDGDGRLDLFVTHLRGETNTLYRRASAEAFLDATDTSGLGLSSTSYTGFGTCLADFDHDGDLDLLVVNGAVKRRSWVATGVATDEYWKRYAEPNLLYLNDGTGRFQDVSAAAGAICDRAEISRGLAVGDLDGDGDLDVLITQTGGPARLFRNDVPKAGRWLFVRAVDPALKRDAVGSVVTVQAGGRMITRRVLAGFSYASSSPLIAHFGLGDAERVDTVTIRWPDGATEQFADVPIDAIVELHHGSGQALETVIRSVP